MSLDQKPVDWGGPSEDDMADTSLTDRGYTYEDLKMALTHIRKLESKIRDLESRLEAAGNLRPSLEVLQRMANGLDPFDRGRFQCAVAALPHETPKLSATVGITGSLGGIGEQLDRARLRRISDSGLRVVEPTEG